MAADDWDGRRQFSHRLYQSHPFQGVRLHPIEFLASELACLAKQGVIQGKFADVVQMGPQLNLLALLGGQLKRFGQQLGEGDYTLRVLL